MGNSGPARLRDDVRTVESCFIADVPGLADHVVVVFLYGIVYAGERTNGVRNLWGLTCNVAIMTPLISGGADSSRVKLTGKSGQENATN